MKAYPEYTDSLIEGIDKIPSNWNVMRFRHLFSIGRGLGITKENLQDDGIPCVNYGEIHSKYGFELDLEKHPLKCVHEGYLESSPSSLLNKGDLVYADTSEDLEGSGNFTQLVSDEKTFAGYHTVIARQTRNHDDRFLAYALDSDYCRNQIRRMVKGVKVFSITQAILKDTSILLPSYDEQRSISSFLDVNTSRIDNLIAEKENFIKLLSEKRQALISHVVTKGLNPNVPMKDSGVDWIGQIPEDWEMTKLKYVGSAIIGLTYSPEDVADDGVLVLRSTNIQNGKISLHNNVYVQKDIPEKLKTKIGDILICSRNGSRKLIGKNAQITKESENQSFGAFTTVFRSESNDFIYFILNSNLFEYQAGMFLTTTVNQLTTGMLNNFEIPFPPEKVREEIVENLKLKLEKVDQILSETLQSIELLKEHRTALISAAVTGKIDVREEV